METASGRQAGVAGRQPVSLPVGDPGARYRDPRHIQLFHAGGQGDQARALRGSLGEGRRLSYFFLAAGCSILSSWARMFLSLAPKKPASAWSPRMIPRASMKSMYGTIRMPSRLSFHCTNFFTWASFVMPAAKFGSNALRYIGKLLVTPSSKATATTLPRSWRSSNGAVWKRWMINSGAGLGVSAAGTLEASKRLVRISAEMRMG